jgi:hypothetical protein
MPENWEDLREPGLVHVLITSRDESSAYRVFDALVDRFPCTGPPALRSPGPLGAPAPGFPRLGLVVLSVHTPTGFPPGGFPSTGLPPGRFPPGGGLLPGADGRF